MFEFQYMAVGLWAMDLTFPGLRLSSGNSKRTHHKGLIDVVMQRTYNMLRT